MSGSYEKIDYRLRPAKSVERKMFAEAFRRLSPFARVDMYRYVGFGSLYFSDFSLFHKLLGFKDMVSIEDVTDPTKQKRFEFNRPYNSIQMKFGVSQTVLPKLSWEPRTIFWLDYDTSLTPSILDDISMVCSKAASGSILIVTVCIPRPRADAGDANGDGDSPLESLKKRIGPDRVPPNLLNRDLAGWGTARVFRTIISNQIEEALNHRNGILPSAAKLNYEQLFNFHYADGMKILTVGGVLFDEGQRSIFNHCNFHELDFYRKDEEPYEIDPPLLTFREMRALERDLPECENPAELPLSSSDIGRFKKVYRYFPTFAETEI